MAGNPTVQDILRRFYPKYLEEYTPNARQAKAAVHILNCKTGAYGVNVSRCGQCGHIQIHNNSCRTGPARCARRSPMSYGSMHRTNMYWTLIATVYKGNIIKNLIMDCQSYTKYRPNETTGGIFVSRRRKEELSTGA